MFVLSLLSVEWPQEMETGLSSPYISKGVLLFFLIYMTPLIDHPHIYGVVAIGNCHYTTFCFSCLLLYCHNSNRKAFIHHSILIYLADLLGQRIGDFSREQAVIQPHLSVNIGSRYPVLPLWLKEKLQSYE